MTPQSATIFAFWQHFQARNWAAAHALLAPDFAAHWPHTGERFAGRDTFIAMNHEYPEGWTLRVLEVTGTISQIEIIHGDERYVAASFFAVREGKLASVTEYWVQCGAESPPPWRRNFAEQP